MVKLAILDAPIAVAVTVLDLQNCPDFLIWAVAVIAKWNSCFSSFSAVVNQKCIVF